MNRQLSFASFNENFAMLQKIQPQLLQLFLRHDASYL
jgi:hypothetical protein